MAVRPTPDQVLLLAPDRQSAAAASGAADPAAWSAAGCDDEVLWGQYVATAAEPYEVSVALEVAAFRCTCPSRKLPCKHCLGLLLLYAQHQLAPARRLSFVDEWLQRRARREAAMQAHDGPQPASDGDAPTPVQGSVLGAPSPRVAPDGDQARSRRRTERAERMRAGLVEFDRWLADRIRVGLAAAELGHADTWDRAAARLVDAQCGGLANRVKRVAARVGQHQHWHDDVLDELAVLHLLVQGALRTGSLPDDLADGVHAATGLTTTQAEVLAGVPSTSRWHVLGESRVREDRITVQRTWLRADDARTWALLLSFGALGRDVESDHEVGTRFIADVHWYPGAQPLRALVGAVHQPPEPDPVAPQALGVGEALAAAGWMLAAEPWLERVPVCMAATPVPVGDGRWVLADHGGAVPLAPGFGRVPEMVALSGGAPLVLMGEWSADGVLPLTMWAPVGAGASMAVSV